MKLTPYKELLAMTKEKIDEALAGSRANTALCKAQLEVAKIDEALATSQGKINEECSKKDLDFNVIIDLLDEVALAERRRSQFQQIIDQMFPTTLTPATPDSAPAATKK